MEDNLKHSPTPDYEKIMNEYLADDEDGSSEGSEGDEVEAKKDDEGGAKLEDATVGKKDPDQSNDETNIAGPSNLKLSQSTPGQLELYEIVRFDLNLC
jgi:hypothetical protein